MPLTRDDPLCWVSASAFEDGFESHIVKIGMQEQVQPDATGWKSCTAGRDVASRILHPVRDYQLPNNRCAVLYRDAYMLFGGYGTKTRVEQRFGGHRRRTGRQ